MPNDSAAKDPRRPQTTKPTAPGPAPSTGGELCEICGSNQVTWRSCKLICSNCRSIVKSCADL